MSKYVFFTALLLILILSSSCSSSSGCRGGGWYGDRNLTEVTPVAPVEKITSPDPIVCKP